ncbi:indolepyruvate oxidoreductase subunit beta [Hippea jasoniae]|uniref:indolepyruvate oxidoreductase subunit beta n=1 Tax=Hippea jasoniae TaxID=944479 RepID=UPI0005517C47|nr:indolepyruvate oxidoreductase subunit beta [Hippea jasoniae]
MIKGILFAGVGGDGIITASNIVAAALMNAGFDVKKSEIHGMSQRGGSVTATVRFGKKVYSPTEKLGNASFLFATEKVEALRSIPYLNHQSVAIVNDRVVPIVNQTIDEGYIDKNIDSLTIGKLIKRRFLDDALKIGNSRVANTIMIGVLAKFIDVDETHFFDAIEQVLPQKLRTINVSAFSYGLKLASDL